MLLEKELGVVMLNGYIGHNNAKVLDKSKKGSWEWTYTAAGRHLVRMHWLTIFVSTLFDKLAQSEDAELPKTLRESYDIAFGPHHPWIVRKGAGLAMRAAPARETLMATIQIKDGSGLNKANDGFKLVEKALDEFLTENDLKGLP